MHGQAVRRAATPDNSVEVNSPSVLGRALRILDAFTDGSSGLTLTALSQSTHLPKASLHRMLGQLVDLGMLERVGNSYFLGLHLFELAKQVPLQAELRETALPYLMDLYERVHETIHLGVLQDVEVVYVERLGGHQRGNCATRVGGRMPAYCTGLGKAMLARSSRDQVRQVIARGLKPLTPHTICAPGLLIEDLVRGQTRGYAVDGEESMVGVTCVAAPIVGNNGRAIAAISVSGPTNRTNLARYGQAVVQAATGVTRSLRERDDSGWR
jgi:IclR family acetate operon transcriptional repressor